MFDALVLWLHILGAITFIGPQIFLAAIAMPAIRTLPDAAIRSDLTRKITRGFGALGGGALVLLLVTGAWNVIKATDGDPDKMDFNRYFWAFNIKMVLVLAVIVLTALHGMVFGKRLQTLQERGAPQMEIDQARQASMLASMGTLGLSVLVVLFAAVMASDWSKFGGLR